MPIMATETNNEDDGIDYIQAKKDFMDMVEHWTNNQRSIKKRTYEIHSAKNIEKKIGQILNNSDVPNNCSRYYEVKQKGGKDKLFMRKKYTLDPEIQILSWDEIFDLFMPIHVQSGHKGRDFLMNITGMQYKYPSMCLTFFKRVCNVCKHGSLLATSKVGLVYVISMVQIRSNEQFRYVLIYADKETNFVVLRPLTAKTDLEIAMELFKIFTTFGPPKKLLLHGYNSNLTKMVDQNLKEICPEFKLQVEHNPVSYDLPTIVTDRIQEWMQANNSDIWEIGAFIVQRQMNNDPKMKPIKGVRCEEYATPHSLFFHLHSSDKVNGQPRKKVKKSSQNIDEESSFFDGTKSTVDKDLVVTQAIKLDDSIVITLDDESESDS